MFQNILHELTKGVTTTIKEVWLGGWAAKPKEICFSLPFMDCTEELHLFVPTVRSKD